jgi:hypothetical protein
MAVTVAFKVWQRSVATLCCSDSGLIKMPNPTETYVRSMNRIVAHVDSIKNAIGL